MPAMSPTMTEGNIASWKVKEGKQSVREHKPCHYIVLIPDLAGESFATGDVLLEIETDKAQMEVEAQEDGQMAKITVLPTAANPQIQLHIDNSWTTATNWIQRRKGRHAHSCFS